MGMETLIKANENELIKICQKTLSKYFIKVYQENSHNYFYAEGTTPVLLVAHLDTVFPETYEKEFYYDSKKMVAWCPQGAGFDDRAGVYAIFKLLAWGAEIGIRPYVLFTTGEEMGGVGASVFCKDCNEVFNAPPVKFIIELDRRGKDDCVFYGCHNLDFIQYIQSKGFIYSFGSYSDISFFAKDINVAAVNLSIGYEYEHSYSEILHFDWMKQTIEKVKEMLEESYKLPFFLFENCKKN